MHAALEVVATLGADAASAVVMAVASTVAASGTGQTALRLLAPTHVGRTATIEDVGTGTVGLTAMVHTPTVMVDPTALTVTDAKNL